jgi:alpha-tubulin suppressor-like RCC1 family protein
LNFAAGETRSNASLARIGSNGAVCLFVSTTTSVIVDVTGYFSISSGFVSLPPARLSDSRPGMATVDGAAVGGGSGHDFDVQVTGRGGVPVGAIAAALNVTVDGPVGAGFMTVYPCSEQRPTASSLNFVTGQTAADAVVIKLGADGRVCAFSNVVTDLVVDVTGWFASGSVTAVSPARLVDTREPTSPAYGRKQAATTFRVQVAGVGPVPADAGAAIVTVTAVDPGGAGFVSLWPCGYRPNASELNHQALRTTANLAVTALDATGGVCVFNQQETDVIIDVTGYFASTSGSPPTTATPTIPSPAVTTTTTSGNTTSTTTTAPAEPNGTATAVAAGFDHSCALLTKATIKCWGWNYDGQLGNGTSGYYYDSSATPVPVTGITNAAAVVAGRYHSCALLTDATIKCWGLNYSGELGNGTRGSLYANSATPLAVTGITNASAVALGDHHSCALLTDATIKCWGRARQLGNGIEWDSPTPVTVTGISNAIALTAGSAHTCALLADATIKCWGRNVAGQLGNGTTTNFSLIPVTVSGITNATAITGGEEHSCALLADATIKCWGWNALAQLGGAEVGWQDTWADSAIPVPVNGVTNATGVTAGRAHTCALLSDSTLICWGYNSWGQLGNGTTNTTATKLPVIGITTAAAITAGDRHTCTLLTNATIKCWGLNYYGELGNGTTADSLTPVTVLGV